jgi:hypothetical protein
MYGRTSQCGRQVAVTQERFVGAGKRRNDGKKIVYAGALCHELGECLR